MRSLPLSLALYFLLAASPAHARDATQAEHNRLSDEIERLVQRQVWSGVERKFEEMERLDVMLTQQDYLNGAYAARELGDVQAAYERLYKAKELNATKEIIDWLWDIDRNYGHVELVTVPSRGTELVTELMPFDVNQRKAVEIAIASAKDSGHFAGLIPRGSYVFAGQQFRVEPGVSVRIEVSPRIRRQGMIDPVIIYRDTPGGLPAEEN
jgi:hypothetical protein